MQIRKEYYITVLIVTLSLAINSVNAEQSVYSTWNDFEADKLASAWLLKRFIASDAQIEIYPKGQVIKRGIQFDTPFTDLSRKFNKATFEILLEYYRIKDRKLLKIGRIIHDIEINTWEQKLYKESKEIEMDIYKIIEETNSSSDIIGKSAKYFDRIYEDLDDKEQ